MNHIYNLNEGIESVESQIKKTFRMDVLRDRDLKVLTELVTELEKNPKKLAFNFWPYGIIIPDVNDECILPVMRVNSRTFKDERIIGSIQIPKIYVSTVKDFSEKYFRQEGYPNTRAAL